MAEQQQQRPFAAIMTLISVMHRYKAVMCCTCWNIRLLLRLWLLIILFTNKYPICTGWNYKISSQGHVFWCDCTNGIVRFYALQISSPNIPCVSSQTCLPDVRLSCHGNANQFPIRPENEFCRHMMSQCMTSPTFTPAYNGPPKLSFHTPPPNTMLIISSDRAWS